MNASAAEMSLDLEDLLAEIYARYHYDFRHHVRPMLRRRLARACAALGIADLVRLRERITEPDVFTSVLGFLTIQVSDLFRDPQYFLAIREHVVPHLATYPSIKIWVAGCGAGEEAYSFLILLAEAGLLDRTLIYATDIDPESLRSCAWGTYDVDRVQGFSRNYYEAGGRASLADYYTAAYGRVAFAPALRKRLVVSDHCLATDSAFAEVQFVSCRNVLIYFEHSLQERARGLFKLSLSSRGFLGLGSRESLIGSSHQDAFVPFAGAERIYRLR